MPITIGSNIASLSAQRRLSESTSQLSKTFERLSSGQRINKAGDDAAGLAIAESLNSDKRVFIQNVLHSTSENYAATESRIRDAGVAVKAPNSVRLQILQKSASLILTQANVQPQLALTLLNGGNG